MTTDLDAFERVARGRRSVRAFGPERIPDDTLERCLDLALLAPSSHNLHPWQFVWVVDPERLERLRVACLDQPPARAAPTLVVAVARPDRWRAMRAANLAHYEEHGPAELARKYRAVVPLLFEEGPWHVLAPLKAALFAVVGLVRPTWRGPLGRAGWELWATKTTALACENLMLALRAAGWDSCPLEGFDEPRVKRLLGLPRAARVAMVLAIGRRAPGGVSEQVRFARERFVSRI